MNYFDIGAVIARPYDPYTSKTKLVWRLSRYCGSITGQCEVKLGDIHPDYPEFVCVAYDHDDGDWEAYYEAPFEGKVYGVMQ